MTLRSGEIKNIDYLTKEELPGGFSNEMPAPIPPQIEALTPKQVLDLASDIAGLMEEKFPSARYSGHQEALIQALIACKGYGNFRRMCGF